MAPFSLGTVVQYNSASQGGWIDCLIEKVGADGSVQISVKPGYWMTTAEQSGKLRAKVRGAEKAADGKPSSADTKRGGGGGWSADNFIQVGSAPGRFPKGMLLDTGKVQSVHGAVDGLNNGSLSCPEGMCVVYSASSQGYYLLYRKDYKEKALKSFGGPARPATRGSDDSPAAAPVAKAAVAPAAEIPPPPKYPWDAAPKPAPAAGYPVAPGRATPAEGKLQQESRTGSKEGGHAPPKPVGSKEALLALEETKLPTEAELEGPSFEVREVFLALRAWVRARQHQQGALAEAALELRAGHRRSILAFLCSIPREKPIFRSHARELLRMLTDCPEWVRGDVAEGLDLQTALDPGLAARAASREPPPPAPPEAPLPKDAALAPTEEESEAPPPPPPPGPLEPKGEPKDILSGLPPPEAFETRSKHDPGDTFKELRKWARGLSVWDLDAAGAQLSSERRAKIFSFVGRICDRRFYSLQGRELLNMLLGLQGWTDGDVVDASAIEKVLEKEQEHPEPPPPPPPRWDKSPPRAPAAEAAPPAALRAGEPGRPPPAPLGHPPASPAAQGPEKRLAPSAGARAPTAGLRERVEAALGGGLRIADGSALIKLYQDSALGGQARLGIKTTEAGMVHLLLALTGQRLKDLFVDVLREASGSANVYFPHLYLNLQGRKAHPLPADVEQVVQRKIQTFQKWTCIEKAHVLCAKHELTLPYVLAYAMSRAKATKRFGAVWINLGMDTGAQGHGNAVCLQPADGQGAMKALIYDPNYKPGQSHYVHAKKAINDALPLVQRLLAGTGLSIVGSAELFGHALQTNLGTVERHQGWFSKKVTTTQRGYPICGSVVHLLAFVWLSASSSGGAMEDVAEVEAELARVVSEPAGKVKVQQKIGAILQELILRHSDRGADPFGVSMQRRLKADLQEWPAEVKRHGGSLEMEIAKVKPCVFTW